MDLLEIYIFDEKLWLYNALANNIFNESFKCLMDDKSYDNKLNDNKLNDKSNSLIDKIIYNKSKLNFLINKIFRDLDNIN